MSMIRCASCGDIGDCKDEWIEGVFEDANPWRFFCPNCVENRNGQVMEVLRVEQPELYRELTDE